MNKSQQIAIENANKKLQSQSERSAGGAFMRGVGQGITMDFGDEMLAFLKSGGRVNSPEYKKHLLEIRESLKGYKEAFPKSYTGGNITGAVGSALVPGGLALKGGGLALKGTKVLGLGAGEGALTAVGAQEEEKGLNPATMDSAISGATWGVAGAAGFGLLGKGAGILAAPVIEGFRRKYGKKMSLEAEKVLSQMIKDSGESADEIIAKIASGEMPAEGNKTLTMYLRKLAVEDSGLRQKVNTILKERSTRRTDKAYTGLRETLAPGTNRNIIKQKKTELQKMRDEENLLYAPVFEQGGYVSDEIAEFIKNEVIKRKGLAQRVFDDIQFENPELSPFFKVAKNGEVSFTNRPPTLEEAEYILRSIKDKTTGAYKEGRKTVGATSQRLSRELQEMLDNFSPDLADARATAFRNFQSKDALDFGMKALNKQGDEVEAYYEDLLEEGNQEAIRMFKMGIVNGINRALDSRKKSAVLRDINDPGKKINQILRNVIADDDYGKTLLKDIDLADKSNTLANQLNPDFGSQTAEILGGGQKVRSGLSQGLDTVGALMSGNPVEIGRHALRALEGKTTLSNAQLAEVADFLTQRDPRLAEQLITMSGNPELLNNTLQRISNQIGATTAGAGAMEMAR